MIVKKCDMFAQCKTGDALCVTTNGILTKEGKLVMGAGIAKDFRDNYKGIDVVLGQYVKKYGNRAFKIGTAFAVHRQETVTLFSFPTKHNWKDKSDLKLIEQSCIQIKELVTKFKITGDVYIPVPGCGNGGLDWEHEVRPIVERHLTEDKYIICFKNYQS